MARNCVAFILLLAFVCIHGERNYTAAVYEHSSILNPNPHELVDRESALKLMNKNLDIYEEQVAEATKQGVQIIVFPEDGLHGFRYTRVSVYPFCEPVPDPNEVKWNPCLEPHLYNGTEVLNRLSCIARRGSMYLVANMPTRQDCDHSDPNCPPDGRYQFNTNVVFSDDGTLVARYRKQNLYYEYEFNTPTEVGHVIFDTPFAGKFGMFICFDLLFYEPAVSLIEKYSVKQLIFPTAWMNAYPFLVGIQFQRAFASAFGINLLAANLHHPALRMTGSGIYTQVKSFYHHDVESNEGKLIVAQIPINPVDQVQNEDLCKPKIRLQPKKGNKPPKCSDKGSTVCIKEAEEVLKEGNIVPPTFHSVIHHDNFTLIPLTKTVGELQVCSKSLCCYVSYHGNFTHNELYALGVFDNFHKKNSFYIQVCTLLKCANTTYNSCGAKVTNASSIIDFTLWGNFSTQHVFPEIMGSGVTPHLPDGMGWKNNKYYMCSSTMSSGVTIAALYGRWYEKD